MDIRRSIVSSRSLAPFIRDALQAVVQESVSSPMEQAGLAQEVEAGMAAIRQSEIMPDVMSSPQHAMGSLIQSFAAEHARDFGGYNPAAADALEVKFDEHDIAGWFTSLFDWLKQFRKRPLLPSSSAIGTLPESPSVALFADWGTGLYGAPVIANSISHLEMPLHLVWHLGDVYCAGTKKEEQKRLIELWPKRNGAIMRACNSNHEMYSGGEGFFDLTIPFTEQLSSYFALENERWLLVGLDSAHHDHQLAGDQVAWLTALIVRNPKKRVVLCSHHQPFSLLDKQGPKLSAQLSPLLSTKKIFAWYWGHEHRCVLYKKRDDWGLWGRCIGHGGFPYFRDQFANAPVQTAPNGLTWRRLEATSASPGGTVLDGPNANIPEHTGAYGPHGFATITLADTHIQEFIHDADGTVVAETRLI